MRPAKYKIEYETVMVNGDVVVRENTKFPKPSEAYLYYSQLFGERGKVNNEIVKRWMELDFLNKQLRLLDDKIESFKPIVSTIRHAGEKAIEKEREATQKELDKGVKTKPMVEKKK